MKKELSNYRKAIDKKLRNQSIFSKEEIEEHLIKIHFFQHERLIHLLVTLFFGIFTVLSFFFSLLHPLLLILPFLFVLLLIFYVFHYFFLENNVQYLYKQYDKMKEKEQKNER